MLTFSRSHRQAASFSALILALAALPASADWQQDDKTLSWKASNAKPDALPVWRFSFDNTKGKSFFEPLTVAGGPELTNYKPEDHPWHYGLWFSWKYIDNPDHVNYWEEDPKTGNAASDTFGKTGWKAPKITTKPDGSAAIHLDLTYTSNKGVVNMTEARDIAVSPVAADGSYKIDWRAHFTVGTTPVDLDRTPMPGEPKGATNGGYAGIGLRMAGNPLIMKVTSTIGPIDKFESSRARPNAAAIACNFTKDGKEVGSIALFSDPDNTEKLGNGKDASWYIINDDTLNSGAGFRFACPSILGPKIIHLDAGKTLDLHYQFALTPKPWSTEALKTEQEAWLKTSKSAK
ncbi:MAG TPA: DUF6807 family protein [Phycisphaerae bacterium]|jgi:hypothetical protein